MLLDFLFSFPAEEIRGYTGKHVPVYLWRKKL